MYIYYSTQLLIIIIPSCLHTFSLADKVQNIMDLPAISTVTPKGTLPSAGNLGFNKYLKDRLQNPYSYTPRSPKRASTAFSERAKRGFQYWYDDQKGKRPPSGIYLSAAAGADANSMTVGWAGNLHVIGFKPLSCFCVLAHS